jgi:hypothetical protein
MRRLLIALIKSLKLMVDLEVGFNKVGVETGLLLKENFVQYLDMTNI